MKEDNNDKIWRVEYFEPAFVTYHEDENKEEKDESDNNDEDKGESIQN